MFEWDEAKRESTLKDRGLDFADARPLFDGRPVVEFPAKTPTETRTLTVGQLGDSKFYTVVWTWRGKARRIISFRRARDEEERRHRLQHGTDHPGDG